MFKFIGKALAGLVLDEKAQAAVVKPAAKKGKAKAKPAASAKDAAIAQVQAQAKDLLTPDRAELIQNAMKVRAAKQTILANLDDESRARLVATAMKALLNEGSKKE
jgi:hypothetical protein